MSTFWEAVRFDGLPASPRKPRAARSGAHPAAAGRARKRLNRRLAPFIAASPRCDQRRLEILPHQCRLGEAPIPLKTRADDRLRER
jgi:hypothetical protein